MVAQIDEQQAAVIADAMAPAGKPDVGAILGEGQGAAGVGAVAMHDCRSFSLQAALRRCLTENAQRGKRAKREPRDPMLGRPPRGNWATPAQLATPMGTITQICKFLMTDCAKGYNEFRLPKRWGSSIMTNELENSNRRTQRTRRNLMKMGAIAVPATLATVHSAAAGCSPILCDLWRPVRRRASLQAVGGGGNCFLKGTKIQTAEGERKIEDLAIGDLLPTMFGGLRPVQWIGRYPIKKSDPSKPWVKDALPVRIARSALAPECSRMPIST